MCKLLEQERLEIAERKTELQRTINCGEPWSLNPEGTRLIEEEGQLQQQFIRY